MERDQFHQLLKTYLDGTCAEEERLLVEHWYSLIGKDNRWKPAPDQVPALEQAIWNKIEEKTLPAPAVHKNNWWKFAAAAMLVLAAGIFWLYQRTETAADATRQLTNGYVQVENRTRGIDTILLEDNSSVLLQPGASLRYPTKFKADKREVYLTGTAFFEIARQSSRPFFVYAGELTTQVLGTSFEVREMQNQGSVEVTVRTGKVSVFQTPAISKSTQSISTKANGVILEPNQKVRYFLREQHFITEIADKPLPVASIKTNNRISFTYMDTPLENVIKELESVYHISVEMEDENLKSCPFTGQLDEKELFNSLELICTAVGITYEKQGLKILLKGKGCRR
ncbi:FecR family protein [Flavihumibacter sp. UBA7668]|uniref:FecR family protein n=1 Tax=Flavihumibacter sp. UBA7668 TaxID=1946542 RepID=UPI0025BCB75A|nr:FecR family protein [Flavihumibacter sp. UBA7668]